jgi:hypothetical protein
MWGTRILACCTLLETGLAQLSKSGKGLRRDGNLDHLLIREKQLRQLPPAAIAGVLRVMYPNAALTMLFWGVCGASMSRGTFAATVRFAPRSETGRRAVARACPS